jgi:hypothetical protein
MNCPKWVERKEALSERNQKYATSELSYSEPANEPSKYGTFKKQQISVSNFVK